ncbi:cyclin-like protein [Obelidium mucronatum]|nr:cyclin-like protein [Obelidium mucronatum]
MVETATPKDGPTTNKPLHLQNKQAIIENPEYIKCSRDKFVSAQEQLLMCKVYETKVTGYVKVFKFDEAVHATSVALFKRFYLKQAVFNYDPKIILLTCIFLAAKIESSYIPLTDFLAKVPASQRPELDIVREMELIVADTVGFQFMVHQVRWPLHGLFLDLQTYFTTVYPALDARKQAFNNLAKIYGRARELSQIALCSDLQFTHWSSQIALGCFLLASQELDMRADLDRYISYRIDWIDTDTIASLHVKLEGVTNAIAAQQEFEKLAKDPKSVVGVKVKEVNAKLAGCLNPEYLAVSKLHEKRKREAEAAKDAKRQKKNAKEAASHAATSSVFD